MNLAQILDLIIKWGSEDDLEGKPFNVSKVGKDKFMITKGE